MNFALGAFVLFQTADMASGESTTRGRPLIRTPILDKHAVRLRFRQM